MYISKRVLAVLGIVLGVIAVLAGFSTGDQAKVHAQEEVALYNARYIFVEQGCDNGPPIFDTATGVFRTWDAYPEHVVRSYTFEDHKQVVVDNISYK